MEPSQVRRHVRDSLERARLAGAARRASNDAATRAWESVRDTLVVPTWQQAVQVLRSEGYRFQVSTPYETVRVSSEKTPQDGTEITLDTTGPSPILVVRVTRSHGRGVLSEEKVAASGADAIAALSEEQALSLLLEGLAPYFER